MNAPAITVPQANPGAGYRALQAEIDAAVARALQSGWYILGQEVRSFEAEFAAWLGATAAVGCGNGTDALALALRALGVGPGTSVVTVSHTAVATVAAIEMVGATPLLIDIEPDCYTMDPAELSAVLDHPPAGLPPVRAVIPVHLYGQPAALEPIMATCRSHGVPVIEDCAQAHGATIGARKVGTFTEVATFSFYPTKNLGALGDGGMLATAGRCSGRRHCRAAPIWLAYPLHQRLRRREQSARRTTGRDPAREAATPRCAERTPAGDCRSLRRCTARHDAHRSGPACRRRPCVPSLRVAHAGPRGNTGEVACRRNRHRHPLPQPGPSAAGVSRAHRPWTVALPRHGDRGGAGAEPADVSGIERWPGRAGMRGAASSLRLPLSFRRRPFRCPP